MAPFFKKTVSRGIIYKTVGAPMIQSTGNGTLTFKRFIVGDYPD